MTDFAAHPRGQSPGRRGAPFTDTKTPEEDDVIVGMFRDGVQIAEIAQATQRSIGFVADRLQASGARRRYSLRFVTLEEEERMWRMYTEEGLSGTSIAKQLRRSPECVYRHLRAQGAKLDGKRHPTTRLSNAKMQRTSDLYASGMTIKEVAAELGVSDSTVWYRLKRLGVPRRTRQQIKERRVRPVTREQLREMITAVQLYRSGMPMSRIAQQMGIPQSNVRRRLVWAKEPRRTHSAAARNFHERRVLGSNQDLGLMRPAA